MRGNEPGMSGAQWIEQKRLAAIARRAAFTAKRKRSDSGSVDEMKEAPPTKRQRRFGNDALETMRATVAAVAAIAENLNT